MVLDDPEEIFQQQIFQTPPDVIDETWKHGAILGGILYDVYTTLRVANAFKLAGDILVDKVLASDTEAYEIIYPVLYNYRHCLELYLKAVLKDARGHNLLNMTEKLEEQIQKQLKAKLPTWFRKWILEFDEFDRGSDTFRYTDKYVESRHTQNMGEFWIDFVLLKKIMALYQEAFHRLANISLQKQTE
ncbi:hypothetical protein [Phormidium tenue]|uniref:HEPN domain-containing protein n=1 Tax=Phormidium tenue NIES-30 TaxID=549789 RepID=A0A1U7J512_9CYAN|nr:hypothetical protein [Phormidium tenue]MBD2232548.1 hypothetical protein [Phormidium tenue FACHB-1052]OKH47687.1 hypothetical protein NIES30_11900 [Phormidium tenue NIES-30]